jgi:hypothetical protein
MCIAIGLLIEWTISGHVKPRLWVFFVSDKQSDSVCYYMERGQKETKIEAHPEKVGFQDWVVSRWVGSTVNVVKIESWLAVMLQQIKVDIVSSSDKVGPS